MEQTAQARTPMETFGRDVRRGRETRADRSFWNGARGVGRMLGVSSPILVNGTSAAERHFVSCSRQISFLPRQVGAWIALLRKTKNRRTGEPRKTWHRVLRFLSSFEGLAGTPHATEYRRE